MVSNSCLFHGVVMLAVLTHDKGGQNGRGGGGDKLLLARAN